MFTLLLLFAILIVVGAVGVFTADPTHDRTLFRVSSAIFLVGMLGCGILWFPVFAGPVQ